MNIERIKNKRTFIGFAVIVVVMHLSMIIVPIIHRKKVYNSKIEGVIWRMKEGRGGIHYQYDINNISQYFLEEDFFEEGNNIEIKIGDSVYKSERNDTLFIYKKNNMDCIKVILR